MNHNEIEACLLEAQKGNQNNLSKILDQYKPFIFKTAKEYNIKNYEFNDLVQICNIALLKAVSKYKTGSNTFSTYAYNSIKNELKYTARQNKKYNKELSLNLTLQRDEECADEFIEFITSNENLLEDVIKNEKINEVKKGISKLTDEERELVSIVYYNGDSLKAYADKKGLNYLQVVRRKNRVLEKLSNTLEN